MQMRIIIIVLLVEASERSLSCFS